MEHKQIVEMVKKIREEQSPSSVPSKRKYEQAVSGTQGITWDPRKRYNPTTGIGRNWKGTPPIFPTPVRRPFPAKANPVEPAATAGTAPAANTAPPEEVTKPDIWAGKVDPVPPAPARDPRVAFSVDRADRQSGNTGTSQSGNISGNVSSNQSGNENMSAWDRFTAGLERLWDYSTLNTANMANTAEFIGGVTRMIRRGTED